MPISVHKKQFAQERGYHVKPRASSWYIIGPRDYLDAKQAIKGQSAEFPSEAHAWARAYERAHQALHRLRRRN